MHKKIIPLAVGGLFILTALSFCALVFLSDKDAPQIAWDIPARVISGQKMHIQATDDASGLDKVVISAYPPGKEASEEIEVIVTSVSTGKPVWNIEFTISTGLPFEGEVIITVTAQDKSLNNFFKGNKTVCSNTVYLDNAPPAATFDKNNISLAKGESALLRFEVSEDLSAIKLYSGSTVFKPFMLDKNSFAAFVTLPFDSDAQSFNLALKLTDTAGNSSTIPVPVKNIDTQFANDNIILGDDFLNSKAKELSDALKIYDTPLKLYLLMNSVERAKNYASIEKLCRTETIPAKLWSGAFYPQPDATRRGEFADQRSYFYDDELIDSQVHQGLDYASVANADIPAAGDGTVIFTGYLGIHGNMILIDHGLGLHSLYSHLSEIWVKYGQQVKKGEVIGKTGKTGLAGGDHLHFEMLVNGISVNPLPWFDAEWVEQNIESRLSRY